MVYVLGAGLAGRSDRSVAIAGAVVACESMIFAANGFRCPLTDLAESHGADQGSVTDLYLPAWFARNLPAIDLPIVLLAIVLHRRHARRRPFGAGPRHLRPGPRVTHGGRTGSVATSLCIRHPRCARTRLDRNVVAVVA